MNITKLTYMIITFQGCSDCQNGTEDVEDQYYVPRLCFTDLL